MLLSVPAHPQEFPASRSRCTGHRTLWCDSGKAQVDGDQEILSGSVVNSTWRFFQCGEQEQTWPHVHEGQFRAQLQHLWQPLSRAQESPAPRCVCRVMVVGEGREAQQLTAHPGGCAAWQIECRFWWNPFSDLIYLPLIPILAGPAIFGVKVQVQFLLERIKELVVFRSLSFLAIHVHSFFQLLPMWNLTILEHLQFVTQYPFFKNISDTINALAKHFIISIILKSEPSIFFGLGFSFSIFVLFCGSR